ncbi:MAG: hypothetical protein PVI07_14345, partial [Anaerolineae bacterium]|jgi:hypothetical protein
VGVVLTTQNPVDLDYKGLTNAGTWFIGRLQTERDKMRVLDGLESASSQAGQALDRGELSDIISALGKRVFLLHNVHEEAPVTFQTRWAMSYLRGPLTRLQVRELMKGSAPDQPSVAPVEGTAFAPAQPTAVQPTSPGARRPEAAAAPEVAFASSPPSLSSRIQQAYLPVRRAASAAALDAESREGGAIELQSRHLLYVPAVVGMGRVHFVDERKGVQEQEDFALLAQAPESIGILAWEQAQPLEMTLRDLSDRPEPEAYFDELPQAINESKEFTALKDDLDDYLYRNTAVTLLYSPVLEAYSKPRESERDFRMRLQQAAREKRDEEIDEINERYEKKLDTLEDRLRRYEAKLAEREADVAARKRETVVSVGESMVGLFLGRRSTRMASTALSKQRQAAKAKLRVEEAEDDVKALQEDIEELEEELQEEVAAIQERWEEALETFEEAKVTPRRADIQIDLVALAWVPHWQLTYEARGGIVRTDLVEAY